MKIGLDTYSFHIALAAGAYDLFQTLDRMETLRLSGLQININGPNGRFLGGDPSDKAHVQRVRHALEQKGFFVEIGGRSTRPDMLNWQLRLCADIGADVFRTLLVFQNNLQETFDNTRRDLDISLPLAQQLGVRIALENHEDVTAAELLRLIEHIDHPFLGACLDTGNDLVVYGEPQQAAERLAPRAFTTHIKDHLLVSLNDVIYSVGVPLGTGDVDLPGILGVIHRDSALDRILIQDTYGYAAPLNPFKRADLTPQRSYADVPCYESIEDLIEDGLLLNLDGLTPQQLRAQAIIKDKAIEEDITYISTAFEIFEENKK